MANNVNNKWNNVLFIFRQLNEGDEQVFEVYPPDIHVHPSYNSITFDSDIGVICLPYEATLNNFVDIVCMPTGSSTEVTTNCFTLGKHLTLYT